MKPKGQLPNLIVIGAMKCGTTSLHHYLSCHPDIFMSERKEIDFFVEELNFNRNSDWYRSHFVTEKPVCGESSQNYTKAHHYKGVAGRMHALIPHAKLIYIVRDPIERLISHYYERLTGEDETQSFEAFLGYFENLRESVYVKTSMYYFQISEYLTYYRPDQIHVLSTESLHQDTQATMERIFRFLGLESYDTSIYTDQIKNASAGKKSLSTLGKWIRKNRWITPLTNHIPAFIKQSTLLRGWMKKDLKKVIITPDNIKKLKDILREDVTQFRTLTGHKFAEWSL